MDPMATLQRWLAAIESGDEDERHEMMRAYRAWIKKDGFPAECKAWSERVFGVPVHCVVLALGTKLAHVHLSYGGSTWSASIPAGNLILS